MNRRSFLKSILALGAAPAIVKAESLMKIWTPPQDLILPSQEVFPLESVEDLTFYGAQIEKDLYSTGYIGSVRIYNRALQTWELQSITMKSADGSIPTMRIDLNGLSIESGGEVVSRVSNKGEWCAPAREDLTAKLRFSKPEAYVTLGSPESIGVFDGAMLTVPMPKQPTDPANIVDPVVYPFLTDLRPLK